MNRQIHARLSWKVEQVGGYPVSITQTLLASVAAGSSTLQAHALQLCQVGCRRSVNGLHCTPSSAFWVSRIRTKASYSHLNFVPRRKKREKMFLCQHIKCHMWITFFFLMATGQNLQYGGRALFSLFIYLYNICTDFFYLK